MFDIKDKNVLITGATSGIGRAAAINLSSIGANIFFVARDEGKAQFLLDDINKISGKEAIPIIADLSSQSDIRSAAQKFNELNLPLHRTSIYREFRTIKYMNLVSKIFGWFFN